MFPHLFVDARIESSPPCIPPHLDPYTGCGVASVSRIAHICMQVIYNIRVCERERERERESVCVCAFHVCACVCVCVCLRVVCVCVCLCECVCV